MANFCAACGRPVRREGNGWVHYEDGFDHKIEILRGDSQESLRKAPDIEYQTAPYAAFVNTYRIPGKVYWRDNDADEVSFNCPNCSRENPTMGNHQSAMCSCGKTLVRFGTQLYWSDNVRLLAYVEDIVLYRLQRWQAGLGRGEG